MTVTFAAAARSRAATRSPRSIHPETARSIVTPPWGPRRTPAAGAIPSYQASTRAVNADAGCAGLARHTRAAAARGLLLLLQAVGEDDLGNRRDSVQAGPVTLEFAGERDPADRLPAGLGHPLQAGAVRLG